MTKKVAGKISMVAELRKKLIRIDFGAVPTRTLMTGVHMTDSETGIGEINYAISDEPTFPNNQNYWNIEICGLQIVQHQSI